MWTSYVLYLYTWCCVYIFRHPSPIVDGSYFTLQLFLSRSNILSFFFMTEAYHSSHLFFFFCIMRVKIEWLYLSWMLMCWTVLYNGSVHAHTKTLCDKAQGLLGIFICHGVKSLINPHAKKATIYRPLQYCANWTIFTLCIYIKSNHNLRNLILIIITDRRIQDF